VANNGTSNWDVDGYSISVVVFGERISCSAFRDMVLYSATWDRATMTHCSMAAGSDAVEKPLPSGLMVAFGKARVLAQEDLKAK